MLYNSLMNFFSIWEKLKGYESISPLRLFPLYSQFSSHNIVLLYVPITNCSCVCVCACVRSHARVCAAMSGICCRQSSSHNVQGTTSQLASMNQVDQSILTTSALNKENSYNNKNNNV